METLKKLRPDHWAWLHAKFAALVWAVTLLLFTPTRIQDVLGAALVMVVCSAVAIGAIVSSAGLFRSMSNYTKLSEQGYKIELAGLWILVSGPLAYLATQLYLVFQPSDDPIPRVAQVLLAYMIVAFMFVRIIIIRTHRKRASQ